MNVLYHHRTRGQEVEGVHIRGIVHALRRRGHRVDIVSPPGVDVERPSAPAGSATPTATRKSSPWSFLTQRAPELVFEAAELGYNGYAVAALSRRFAEVAYDLCYERYALFSAGGVELAKKRAVPFILEVNDSAIVPRIRPLKMQAAACRAEQHIWQRADAIVTITPYFRDLIIEQGVAPERITVIPNAIDAPDYATLPDRAAARARLGLDGKIVLGYVGALNHWRRLDLLIDAFAALASKHPRAHLLLVGDGPDRASIEAGLAQRGLADRATLTGRLPHDEMPAYLRALDVAVLPHSNLYGSPMKLFEYMASECPIVAPCLPPIATILRDLDAGMMFAELDGDALTRALDTLLSNDALRGALGRAARKLALERYTWDTHAETLLRLYGRLVRR